VRIATWAILRKPRMLRNCMATCGSVDDLVQEVMIRILETDKMPECSKTTLVINHVKWTLSRIWRVRSLHIFTEEDVTRFARGFVDSNGATRKIRPHDIGTDVLTEDPCYVEENNYMEIISGEMDRLLDPRRKKIVEMRFGLNGFRPMSLREIGKDLSISPERVRQLEKKSIEKLQEESAAITRIGKELEGF